MVSIYEHITRRVRAVLVYGEVSEGFDSVTRPVARAHSSRCYKYFTNDCTLAIVGFFLNYMYIHGFI